jgi:hypothetical protein
MEQAGGGDQLWTPEEAAEYCKVHPRTLFNWRKQYGLQVFKLPNGSVRFVRAALDAFIARHMQSSHGGDVNGQHQR